MLHIINFVIKIQKGIFPAKILENLFLPKI